MEEDFESFGMSGSSLEQHTRTIVHLDVDCFYAQVEMLKTPELRVKPLGIKQKNYVITSNYIAREYGVKKCMTINEALKVCPQLILVNGEDLTPYKQISSKISSILRTFSPIIERSGIDEAHVDITDLCLQRLEDLRSSKNIELVGNVFGSDIDLNCHCGCTNRLKVGSIIAQEMREKVKTDLGLTCCAGIAHNKLLAKLACRIHKPNQQTTVFPLNSLEMMLSQKELKAIPGIGHKMVDSLNSIGIYSIEDLQNTNSELLEEHFPKHTASWMKDASFGIDNSEVKVTGKPQSISVEDAFIKKVSDLSVVRQKYRNLIKKLLFQVNEDGRIPQTIRVTVRIYNDEIKTNNSRESRQQPADKSWFTSCKKNEEVENKVLETVMKLFVKMVPDEKFHLTLVGVGFTNFSDVSLKNSVLNFFNNQPSCSDDSKNSSKLSSAKQSVQSNVCLDNLITRKRTVVDSLGVPSCGSRSIDSGNNERLMSAATAVASGSTNTNSDVIPPCPAVDSLVWSELPIDIRREIVSTCSTHVECNNFNFRLDTEFPVLPKKAKSDPKCSKQKSIKNYFSK